MVRDPTSTGLSTLELIISPRDATPGKQAVGTSLHARTQRRCVAQHLPTCCAWLRSQPHGLPQSRKRTNPLHPPFLMRQL